MATRTELVYGRSGSGKTSWSLRIARWLWEEKGLKTRWLIADGGVETVESSGMVDAGVVEVFQYNNHIDPFLTSQQICEGYWPVDPLDPKSKMIAPNYEQLAQSYGMWVFEGLTCMADLMMSDKTGGLSQRAAMGEKIGQDSPFILVDGGTKFGGNPPSHFGFVQRRIEDNIERCRMLPGWVQWTAWERKAEDEEAGGENLIGPDIAGKKLTPKIGGKFGNTIHMHPVVKTTKSTAKDPVTGKMVDRQEKEYRAYTITHYDPQQRSYIQYYANNRAPMELANEMPEYFSGVDASIEFYTTLEKLKMKGKERYSKK